MLRKALATLVILLFLGLALTPSININIINQDELVELYVELCRPERKHNVKLTKEE